MLSERRLELKVLRERERYSLYRREGSELKRICGEIFWLEVSAKKIKNKNVGVWECGSRYRDDIIMSVLESR